MKSRTNIFTDHPAAVGETYLEHLIAAFGFGLSMVTAGLACFVHGLVPALFVRTGSTAIQSLHERMVLKRHAKPTSEELGYGPGLRLPSPEIDR